MVAAGIVGTMSPAFAQVVNPTLHIDRELAKVFEGDEKYLTIDSMIVESDEGQFIQLFNGQPPRKAEPKTAAEPATDPVITGDIVIDQIINLGARVWDVVVRNRPVVNVSTQTATALPKGVTEWTQLAGWQAPRAKIFRIRWQNLYRMDVVDFSVRVLYTYGGNVRGKGRYLTNVTIVPANLTVAWGYTFNAKASVPSVTNAGTERDPVGAAELLSTWSVDTVLKHEEGSMSFYVRGDGQFLNLTNGT